MKFALCIRRRWSDLKNGTQLPGKGYSGRKHFSEIQFGAHRWVSLLKFDCWYPINQLLAYLIHLNCRSRSSSRSRGSDWTCKHTVCTLWDQVCKTEAASISAGLTSTGKWIKSDFYHCEISKFIRKYWSAALLRRRCIKQFLSEQFVGKEFDGELFEGELFCRRKACSRRPICRRTICKAVQRCWSSSMNCKCNLLEKKSLKWTSL